MPTQFSMETIDDGAGIIGECSLVLDPTGEPTVAYAANRPDGNVLVADRQGGTWTRQDTGGNTVQRDRQISVDIDSRGVPHVAYCDRDSGNAIIAGQDTPQWSFETVPTQAGIDIRPVEELSMQLGSDDVPTVAFHDVFAGERIAVATRDGGTRPWEVTALELITTDVASVGFPSLAFDRSQTPRVAFIDSFDEGSVTLDEQAVRMSAETVDGWPSSSEILDKTVRGVTWVSQAKGASGTLFVAFSDQVAGNLTAWVASAEGLAVEVIAGLGAGGNPRPSAAVDLHGRPCVAYIDHGVVKLATRVATGSWTIEVVGPGTDWPSLAYDNAGGTQLAYLNGALVYARGTGSPT